MVGMLAPGSLTFLSTPLRSSFGSSIPRRIMQFWDKYPPEEVLQVRDEWVRLNPNHVHHFVDEIAAANFIEEHFGADYRECFEYAHHPAMKADMFRLAYIWQNGGVYVDADDSCVVPLDSWLVNESINLVLTLSPEPTPYTHNWFIAARPRHPVIGAALQSAFASVRTAISNGSKNAIWEDTGPGCLSRAFILWVVENWNSPSFASELLKTCLLPEDAYRATTRWNVDMAYRKQPGQHWSQVAD
jgi:mannosyltransferase OCH1-like enzyme